MKTLVWDNSFRRAFKRLICKQLPLQDKIFAVDLDPRLLFPVG